MKLPFWYPPILVYHRVHPDLRSDTPSLSPETFEQQMGLLAQRWKPISLSDLVQALEGKAPLPHRAVVITFDDGTEDNFTYAFPILSRYRIPATLFMIAGNLGRAGFLNIEQALKIQREGISFGSHTLNHDYLPSLPIEQARRSLLESKRILQEAGLSVEFLSYPAGGFTQLILEAVTQAGYRAACTTNRGLRRFPVNRWALRRITMHSTATSALELWVRCSGYYGFNRRLRPPS